MSEELRAALTLLGNVDPFQHMAAPSTLDPCFSCMGYRGPGHRPDCAYARVVPERDRRGERSSAIAIEHIKTHRDPAGRLIHEREHAALAAAPVRPELSFDSLFAEGHDSLRQALMDAHEYIWTRASEYHAPGDKAGICNACTALAEEDALAAAPLPEPDLSVHTQEADGNGVWCREDGQRWPCDTIRTAPLPEPRLCGCTHEFGTEVEMACERCHHREHGRNGCRAPVPEPGPFAETADDYMVAPLPSDTPADGLDVRPGRQAMLQGLRNHRILFELTIRALQERSPASAASHISRWTRAAIEDIDELFAARQGTPIVSRDDFTEAMQRNDMARVIVLALASQGYIAGTDSHNLGLAFLRELEECGYTLRLTTPEERLAKNAKGVSS